MSAQKGGIVAVNPRQSVAKIAQFVFISLTLALLAAIVVCSLTPSPNMREMWWIPDWLGTWADRNGNFRNFPVFAALAALLFFVLRFFQLNTANCRLTTSTPASTSYQPPATAAPPHRSLQPVKCAAYFTGSSQRLRLLSSVAACTLDPPDLLVAYASDDRA